MSSLLQAAALLLCSAVLFGQTQEKPANLPAQPIGANDLVAVSVYDAPEFTRTVRVSSDGYIRLPMLKARVKAEGLLPGALESAIAEALKAEQILVDPFVTVTVAEYASRPISVAGAVKTPITFQAELGSVTLLEAITRAGGLSQDAGPDILVTRTQDGPDGKPVPLTRRIPVKALIDAADPTMNVRLSGGEEVRVPEAGKVYVVGNVKRPGAFGIGDGSETSVLKMLAMAEGLAPYANKMAYIIRRDDKNTPNELPIELKQIMQRKSPDVTLIANDILYVPDNSGRRTALTALEKVIGFGAATASGVIIWSGR